MFCNKGLDKTMSSTIFTFDTLIPASFNVFKLFISLKVKTVDFSAIMFNFLYIDY